MSSNKTMSEQNIESEEKMITGNETIEKKNSKDIITLNVLSEKYGIPYDTLYKEIVRNGIIPFVRFGGIRVSENAFRKIFTEKGFAI